MAVGLPVAVMFFAQAATAAPVQNPPASSYGPVAAAASTPRPPPSDQTQRECEPQNKDPNANEIVVCTVKPDGYRLPEDIVEAKKLKKEGVTIRPHNPHETFADHSCANVGPMGCRGAPTLDMLAVAATAANISKRLAEGKEVGSVFETEKSSTDYQYYVEAKKEREAKDAAAASKAARAKAHAALKAASTQTPKPDAPPPSSQLSQ